MSELNVVNSFFTKMTNYVGDMNTKFVLTAFLSLGILVFILGSINENIINSNTVFMTLLISGGIYYYIKREYSNKLKSLNLKNNLLRKNTILDDICENDKKKNKELCDRYDEAKKNFYTISNLLLQKYSVK